MHSGRVILCVVLLAALLPGKSLAQRNFQEDRENMVNTQLRARDIQDPATLRAMESVPRHLFVPEEVRDLSYTDGPLPIGEGQTISQPYIVAFMTQALDLEQGDRVLEIGTGSGYQAAILSEIVSQVYSIEIVPSLGESASERLENLGYTNVDTRIGDGYNGWPEKGPFDAIMVTAGAETIPEPLVEQLAEGGRMVIPVGPHRGVRQLKLLRKRKGKIRQQNLMAVRFVPFIREE